MKSLSSKIKNRLIRYLSKGARNFPIFDPSIGSLNEVEYAGLKELIAEANVISGPIIEIGTLVGTTTMRMALWTESNVIKTVDNFSWNVWGFTPEEHYNIASHALFSAISSGKVELVKMGKSEFYETYDGPSPSMVFLDAMHTYIETKKDIEWAKKINTRMITGHDYCEEWPGVIRAVDEAGGPKELFGSVWRL